MRIPFRTVENVVDELEAVQRRIANRASGIFRERGGAFGRAVDDWLNAERETIWRPALEVQRTKDAFVVEAAIGGVDPAQLDVQATTNELLIQANLHHHAKQQEGEVILCEFAGGPLFRSYRFPEPIDPARATAEYHNGLLRVTAPVARPATKLDVKAA
jgi:HSP20 family protein